MQIYKVLPDLSKKRHMAIWHKALKSQWSAEDLDWTKPVGIRKARLKDQMARVLTPILMGEQSALYSVTSLIPILGHRSEVESQFYLTTWAVDEARHTELFARYYGRLDREPESIRKFPSGYLFQNQIVSNDPAQWLAGVLVSEVLARLVMQEFLRLDLDPVLSEISEGILEDEARHLGFNHIYLEDQFAALTLKSADEASAEAEHLRDRLQAVLDSVPPILAALETELREVGIDADALYTELAAEAGERLERSIRRGGRIATGQALAHDPSDAASVGT